MSVVVSGIEAAAGVGSGSGVGANAGSGSGSGGGGGGVMAVGSSAIAGLVGDMTGSARVNTDVDGRRE